MITDCYDETEAITNAESFYGKQRHIVDKCLIMFSQQLHNYLLDNFECKPIGVIGACNGNVPIYALEYKGENIAFYLSGLGSAIASGMCYEAHWVVGAAKFIMFGSCGSLDNDKTKGRFIIPTESFRGEGASYYYAPPDDYIKIKNCDKLAGLFEKLGIPYVKGRVWTTDSMLRETRGLVAKRKDEGCIAVEMELAGVQAVCSFYGFELYDFLEAGDVLAESGYEVEGLNEANHGIGKLMIALDIASEINKQA